MNRSYFAAVAVLGAAFAGSALAQPRLIEPFRQCATITSDAARLACFDQALKQAETVVTRDRERTREDFGLSEFQRERLSREEQASRDIPPGPDGRALPTAPEPVPTEVTARVSEVLRDAAGRRIFLLENGQLWRQLANSSLRGEISNGETVTIGRGTLSGFRLTITGRPGFIGVRRVR